MFQRFLRLGLAKDTAVPLHRIRDLMSKQTLRNPLLPLKALKQDVAHYALKCIMHFSTSWQKITQILWYLDPSLLSNELTKTIQMFFFFFHNLLRTWKLFFFKLIYLTHLSPSSPVYLCTQEKKDWLLKAFSCWKTLYFHLKLMTLSHRM